MRVAAKTSARVTASPAAISGIAISQCGPLFGAAMCSMVTQSAKTAIAAAAIVLTATSR